MRRLLLIPICFVSLLAPVAVLAGGGDGFDKVVRAIESRYHVQATRLPFLGVISFVAHKAVNNMHVAEFEDFDAAVDGEELNDLCQSKLGPGWERVIRETTGRGETQTLIFMRPEGSRMAMFVLDADGHEMDVVQLSVSPEHLAETVSQYAHRDHAM